MAGRSVPTSSSSCPTRRKRLTASTAARSRNSCPRFWNGCAPSNGKPASGSPRSTVRSPFSPSGTWSTSCAHAMAEWSASTPGSTRCAMTCSNTWTCSVRLPSPRPGASSTVPHRKRGRLARPFWAATPSTCWSHTNREPPRPSSKSRAPPTTTCSGASNTPPCSVWPLRTTATFDRGRSTARTAASWCCVSRTCWPIPWPGSASRRRCGPARRASRTSAPSTSSSRPRPWTPSRSRST